MAQETGVLGEPVRVHSPGDFDMIVNEALHSPCGTNLVFCDVYDAFYCPACDVWTDRACGDRECPYCPGRSDRPSGTHTAGEPEDTR